MNSLVVDGGQRQVLCEVRAIPGGSNQAAGIATIGFFGAEGIWDIH